MDHSSPKVELTTHNLGCLLPSREGGFLKRQSQTHGQHVCVTPTYLAQTHDLREASMDRDGSRERSGEGTIVVPLSGIDNGGGVVYGGVRHCKRRGVQEGKGKANGGNSER